MGSEFMSGELVQTMAGKWITHPPSRCPNGHTLGPGEVLVGHQACLHYRDITRSVGTAMHDAYSRLPAAARDHLTILSGVGVQGLPPAQPSCCDWVGREVLTPSLEPTAPQGAHNGT